MRGVHSFRGLCPLENMLLSREAVLPPCFKWSHCSWLLASNFRVWAKMRMLSTTDEACHSTWYHTVKLIKTGYFYGRQELGKTLTKNHVRSIKSLLFVLQMVINTMDFSILSTSESLIANSSSLIPESAFTYRLACRKWQEWENKRRKFLL